MGISLLEGLRNLFSNKNNPLKNPELYEALTPRDFQNNVKKKNIQIVDVRTSREYKSGHVRGAKNIDFFDNQFLVKTRKLKKNKPVFIYCHSGNRSKRAALKLLNNGFSKIYDLRGGYMNWR